jgi:hypothetical protein
MSTLKSEPAGQLLDGNLRAGTRDGSRCRSALHGNGQRTAKAELLPLAYIFELLAKFERDHVDRVAEWAAEHKGAAVATVAPWPIPDAFDVSPEEIAQPDDTLSRASHRSAI